MLLLAGPLVVIGGIVAVFFVLRRKSVEKRSMYSARRSQIEHKVRAARQRTLTPHGHAEKPPAPAAAGGASPFDQAQVSPGATYQAPAYEPPPVAPPTAPPVPRRQEAPAQMPWEQPSIPPPAAPAPASSPWDFPAAPPEPFTPAPEPAPTPAPTEPVWTPAPQPAAPAAPMAPAASTAPSTAAGSWSVVSAGKESAAGAEAEPKKKKGKKAAAAPSSSWELASGEAPGSESEELEVRRSGRTLIAVAQYAVLVVGLVMVLVGVLVMVANSHVT